MLQAMFQLRRYVIKTASGASIRFANDPVDDSCLTHGGTRIEHS
jgi:hypothetical protein